MSAKAPWNRGSEMTTIKTKSAAALPLNTILSGDCIDVMNSLPAASVDLIFADPFCGPAL